MVAMIMMKKQEANEILLAANEFLMGYPISPAHAFLRAYELALYQRVVTPSRSLVLDIGCGNGAFFRKLGCEAMNIGLDLDPNALRIAKRKSPFSDVILCDIRRVPIRSDAAHLAICHSVLEHVASYEMTIAEVSRILKGGGRFIGMVDLKQFEDGLCLPWLLERLGLRLVAPSLHTLVKTVWAGIADRILGSGRINEITAEDMDKYLRSAGFAVFEAHLCVERGVVILWDLLHIATLIARGLSTFSNSAALRCSQVSLSWAIRAAGLFRKIGDGESYCELFFRATK
jgi:ubiquinone/menaquinone biosynthesis C-methylase UbiE